MSGAESLLRRNDTAVTDFGLEEAGGALSPMAAVFEHRRNVMRG
jgi:hypothetical protein